MEATELTDSVWANGPFTVFAPTADAVNRLPPDALANFMKPEIRELLRKLITDHIVPARLTAKDLDGKMLNIKSMNRKEVEHDDDDPGKSIRVNQAKVAPSRQPHMQIWEASNIPMQSVIRKGFLPYRLSRT
ncbi:MAG: fasciclin domain-containing protein [Gammaproteobacteria bacterium]